MGIFDQESDSQHYVIGKSGSRISNRGAFRKGRDTVECANQKALVTGIKPRQKSQTIKEINEMSLMNIFLQVCIVVATFYWSNHVI